jgi:hypothetical protein
MKRPGFCVGSRATSTVRRPDAALEREFGPSRGHISIDAAFLCCPRGAPGDGSRWEARWAWSRALRTVLWRGRAGITAAAEITVAADITVAAIMVAGGTAGDAGMVVAGMVLVGVGMALGGAGATVDACGLAQWSSAGKRAMPPNPTGVTSGS